MPLLTFLELENSLKINQLLNHVNQLNNANNATSPVHISAQAVAAASSILATNNQLIKTANGLEHLLQQQSSQQLLLNQHKLLASKLNSLFANNNSAAAAAAVAAASILNASANSSGNGGNSSSKQINYSRYKTELCRQFTENGECKYSDKCQFAHGLAELKDVSRHPKYKTDLCKTFHSKGFCPYGPRCHFLHEINEQNEAAVAANGGGSPVVGGKPAKMQQTPSGKMGGEVNSMDKHLESIQTQLSNIILANGLKGVDGSRPDGKLDLVISTSPLSSTSSSVSSASSTTTSSSNLSQSQLDELTSSSVGSNEVFYTSGLGGLHSSSGSSPSTPARTRSNGSSSASSSHFSSTSSSYDYVYAKADGSMCLSPQAAVDLLAMKSALEPIGKPKVVVTNSGPNSAPVLTGHHQLGGLFGSMANSNAHSSGQIMSSYNQVIW